MAVHLLRYGETSRTVSTTTATAQASATWEVHDLTETVDASGYVVDSGSATVDTTSLNPSATAGPGQANPRRITFASTTGITVGRKYLLTEDGHSEIVEIVGLSTDAYADTKHPLIGTYTTAATLQGLTLTASLTNTIAANEDYVDYDEPLRIVWTYANGEIHQDQIRVVRQDHGDLNLAEIAGVIRDLFPDIGQRMEYQGRGTLESMIAAVIRMHRAEILADGEQSHRQLHGEQGQAVVIWGALEHMAASGVFPGSADSPDLWLEHCRAEHKKFWANTRGRGLAGSRTVTIAPIVETATGNSDPTERQRLKWG